MCRPVADGFNKIMLLIGFVLLLCGTYKTFSLFFFECISNVFFFNQAVELSGKQYTVVRFSNDVVPYMHSHWTPVNRATPSTCVMVDHNFSLR